MCLCVVKSDKARQFRVIAIIVAVIAAVVLLILILLIVMLKKRAHNKSSYCVCFFFCCNHLHVDIWVFSPVVEPKDTCVVMPEYWHDTTF